jgi:hypothetical protein
MFNRLTKYISILAACIGAVAGANPAQAAGKSLKISTKEQGEVINFYVENLEDTEVTATFTLNLQNLQCSQALPYTCTLHRTR